MQKPCESGASGSSWIRGRCCQPTVSKPIGATESQTTILGKTGPSNSQTAAAETAAVAAPAAAAAAAEAAAAAAAAADLNYQTLRRQLRKSHPAQCED